MFATTVTDTTVHAFTESPEYKAFTLRMEKETTAEQAEAKAFSGYFVVASLGISLTMVEVIQFYQNFKGSPKSFYASEIDRRLSISYRVATECKEIISGAGLKAGWDNLLGYMTKYAA